MHCTVISLSEGKHPFLFSLARKESRSGTLGEGKGTNAINSGGGFILCIGASAFFLVESWQRKNEHIQSVPSTKSTDGANSES